jgi:hypothetical protein
LYMRWAVAPDLPAEETEDSYIYAEAAD